MSTEITPSRMATASLVGDACLLTAVTIPLGPLSLVVGPSVAWYLHGRKLDRYAVMAGIAGLFAGLVVVGGAGLLLGFGLESIGLGGEEFVVPLIILGVFALAAGAVGAVAMWVANAVYARLEVKKTT